MPSISQIASFIPGNSPAANISMPVTDGGIGAAGRDLGGAIEGIGGEAQQLNRRIKSATDAAGIMEIDSKLQTAMADYRDWTATNSDKDKYKDEAQTRWQALQSDLQATTATLSPLARTHAAKVIDIGQRTFTTAANALYTKQSLADARGQFDGGRALAIQNMNLGDLEHVYDAGIASGNYSKQEVEKYRQGDNNKIEQSQFQHAMNANPWDDTLREGTKDEEGNLIPWKHLTGTQITDLQKDQRQMQAGIRRDTMAAISQWRSVTNDKVDRDSTVPGFNGMTLGEIEHQQKITGTWVVNLIKSKPVDDVATMNAAKNAMYNDANGSRLPPGYFNPDTPEGRERASNVESAITGAHFTPATATALLEDFKKIKSGKTADEKSTLSRSMADVESLINNGSTLPFILRPAQTAPRMIGGLNFGTKTTEQEIDINSPNIKLSGWEANQNISDEAKATARQRGAELRDGVRDFIEKNPNATFSKVEEEKARIMKPWIAEQVHRALTGETPAPTAARGGFTVGKPYTNSKGESATYLGGDPNDPSSWKQ